MELRPTTDGDLPALHATFVDVDRDGCSRRTDSRCRRPRSRSSAILQRARPRDRTSRTSLRRDGGVRRVRLGVDARRATGSSRACSSRRAPGPRDRGRRCSTPSGVTRRPAADGDRRDPAGLERALRPARARRRSTPLLAFSEPCLRDSPRERVEEAPSATLGDRRGGIRVRPDGRPRYWERSHAERRARVEATPTRTRFRAATSGRSPALDPPAAAARARRRAGRGRRPGAREDPRLGARARRGRAPAAGCASAPTRAGAALARRRAADGARDRRATCCSRRRIDRPGADPRACVHSADVG